MFTAASALNPIVNAIVGLLATGGSTNHTLHLVAMARAAGVVIDWNDFSDLSDAVPLLARIYPNGSADVNHFHAAGGMGFLVRELLQEGLMHEDVETVVGRGLQAYTREPWLSPDGLRGNPGRSVIKVSAVSGNSFGVGRELFKLFRANAADAELSGGVCVP